MYKIGYRTSKTAIGTALAIWLAELLHLQNFASAGIITILCIQVTKKKSLRSSWERFLACLLGIIFSLFFFEGIGYHPLIIGLLLLFFIPMVVMLKAKEGIATSTVIILHLFGSGAITIDLIFNELGIIVIGIGVALLVNLYMPSVENELRRYQEKIENNFRIILLEMVNYLRSNDSNWDGKELTETEQLLRMAKTISFRDVENHFLRHENRYYHYFKMREKQFEILERMLPIVTSITSSIDQGEMVSQFIEELSRSIHPGNTATMFLKKLYDMRMAFQEMPLPVTREEFEVRASLLQFLKEMEQYLIIKRSFKGLNT